MKLSYFFSRVVVALSVGIGVFHSAFADAPAEVSPSAPSSHQSVLQYGQMCAKLIGEIPPFDCNKGTIVPITVDGKTPEKYTKGMTCDRPALLPYDKDTFGQCTPYSKILNLSHDKIQISAFCRRTYLRDPDSVMFDEVDIILHSKESGNTCWFHAQSKPGDSKGFNASRVPPPNEKVPPRSKPAAANFWWPPAATAKKNCASCHDADPFMYSPWLGQVWHMVPTNPLGRYSNLGKDFAKWQSNSISTRDNTCVGCHRIGNQASCSTYIPMATGQIIAPGSNGIAKSYPHSHWMPVNNDQSEAFWTKANVESVHKLMTCCKDPKNAMCAITPIITPAPQ